jgi:SIT family siderophore-iron:H+ symporter-like MFS transporter
MSSTRRLEQSDLAQIGNAVGNSIAGAIWRNTLPGFLRTELAGLLSDADIELVYSSAVTAATYPFGSPERDAIIRACTSIPCTSRATC